LSSAAVFAASVLDVEPAFSVTTNHVELAIMLDVLFAKVLLLSGARWRRDFKHRMKITGSYQYSVRSIKKAAGRITILVE
jgi:hypothetical protein